MDLEYRGILAPNGLATHASLLTPPATTSDLRNNLRLPRPMTAFDFSPRPSEPGAMNKIPAVPNKRRGGCRKACNECKQQKVSHCTGHTCHIAFHLAFRSVPSPSSASSSSNGYCLLCFTLPMSST
ncbi:hypothetical protein BO99DRAFT_172697 [Aspergillus violaceofuscus CBS 115571]|uniref:Uncharacterized protein n=1 Tax=Aspergillus violaceofuscus (strain CBS 115571) TaxID=1450538 RepID=A0A2V5I228_ASPV1|nr:hypothetical protein BO99DRAFT_172697 [Aspergillus violaceofuscus CBS 115571]